MFNVIKEKFKNLRKKEYILKGSIYSNTIYTNDYINLVYDSCKLCYNGKLEDDIEKKVKYIQDKIKLGHESVIAHSNIVTEYMFSTEYLPELLEILCCCKYVTPKMSIKSGIVSLVLAGSIRGYKYLIRNMKNPDNRIARAIIEEMYNLHSCFFYDMIEDGIMNKINFLDIYDKTTDKIDRSDYTIYNVDNIKKLKDLLRIDNLSMVDLLDIGTITIQFKDVSRIISQQITRHEAGISQLSQRYVDYSNTQFNSPSLYKPDMYDKDKQYDIKLKCGNMANAIPFKFTLQELGDELSTIYKQLRDQGLLKEDARAYLLNNVPTTLNLTFTLRNFLHFLYLRVEEHAQAEIRLISKRIEKDFLDILSIYGIDTKDIYKYLEPIYKQLYNQSANYDEIDEVIE